MEKLKKSYVILLGIAYAHYGQFNTSADLIRMSYGGLMRNMGVELVVGPNDLYESFIAENKIADMPLYPAEGSILDVGGYVVIKISNIY